MVFGLVFSGAPAHAASFDWEAEIKVSLPKSREFTTGADGTIKIYANAFCNGGNFSKNFSITLYHKSGLIWNDKGAKSYTCGLGKTNSWSSMKKGKYRFSISKANNGKLMEIWGDVNHP